MRYTSGTEESPGSSDGGDYEDDEEDIDTQDGETFEVKNQTTRQAHQISTPQSLTAPWYPSSHNICELGKAAICRLKQTLLKPIVALYHISSMHATCSRIIVVL